MKILGYPAPVRFWVTSGCRGSACATSVRLRKWVSALSMAALLFVTTACSVAAPGRAETVVITALKRHLTVGGTHDKNPLPPTPETIARGRQAFSAYCSACHGLDGQTTGVPFAAAMSPPIPDLKSSPVQAYSDGQLKWIITHGLSPSGMPASKNLLRDEEMWEIVTYLRNLPPRGSLGEPPAYSGR